MKLQLTSICVIAAALSSVAQAQIDLATWTFESSVPTTSGPFQAESGVFDTTSFASGSHASSSTTYSNPVGNGSGESFSSNNWASGDYYEFSLSTTGYENIAVSWSQISSSTGPRDFKLAYSLDDSSYTDIGSYLVSFTPSWSSGSANSSFVFSYDLSAIGAIEDVATVYFRLIDTSTTSANGGTVASGGTDRVDNFSVTGFEIQTQTPAVPEPSTWGAMAAASLGLLVAARRRRR